MVSESTVCGSTSTLDFFVDGVIPECFMEVILFALNSSFIFIFGLVRIRQAHSCPYQSVPITSVYIIKLCSCIFGVVIPLIQIIYDVIQNDTAAFRIVASLYIAVSWLICALVTLLEHPRGLRSNWISRVWGTSTFMLSALALQSDVHLKKQAFEILLSVLFMLASLGFGICVLFFNHLPQEYEQLGISEEPKIANHSLLEEGQEDDDQVKTRKRKPNPLLQANLMSRLTFQWLNPFLRTGYKRPLELSDLFEPPSAYDASSIAKRFSDIWEDLRIQGKQSLIRAFTKLIGRNFFIGGLYKLAQDLLMFVGPVVLNRIILFVKNPSEPQSTGFVLVGVMFVAAVLQTLFVHQYFHATFCVGMEVHTAIVTAVYRKSFFLSNKARQENTVGEIVNLQSVDAGIFQELFPYLHLIWSAPFQLLVAMFMLWQLLGPSCLAGVGVMILTIPANGVVSKKFWKAQSAIMALRDNRIKLMNEILSGIRIIKFFVWEDSFISAVDKIRNGELATLRSTLWLRTFTSFFWGATPTLVALCTFVLYTLVGNDLTAERAFTALALFNIIEFPMNMLPMIISAVIECKVSMKRLTKFLMAEELDTNAVQIRSFDNHAPVAISIRDGSWTWEKESSKPTLEHISLEVPQGKLVAVVGQVGAGKSSLLAAILGEINKTSGEVKINGTTAYVAQQAWIQSATLKDNILFGMPFNQEKYERVIQVCELTADINMLPNGDLTEIGERGINLSGGQKQRVAIARSIYQNKDNYLMDDCLSAVDAHVGKSIFENAILGELKSKTRLLITHQLQFVWMADVIVVLKDGKISEMGSYDELMKNQNEFYQLISTHVKKTDESINNNQPKENDTESDKPKKSVETSATSSDQNEDKGKLIEAEQREVGHVDSKVWGAYLAAVGGTWFAVLVLCCAAIEQSFGVGASFWLSHWSSSLSDEDTDHGTGYYLGVYTALSVGSTCMVLGRDVMINIAGLKSSKSFHAMMLQTIMRAPMSFFDTTPTGRILNRFSKDIYAIDESLPSTLGMLMVMLFASIGILLSIAVITPIFLIAMMPLGYVYRFTQKFYLQSSREIQRLESITKSPIYAQLSETLNGVSTIRSYRRQDDFISENNNKVNLNISAYFVRNGANRWLGVRLEFIGTCIVSVAAAFAVISRSSVDPGLAGLSITSALSLTGLLNWLVRMATETETQMISVERARQYTLLPQEAPAVIEHNRPPANWPTQGSVELNNVKLRYREGLDLTLKGISVRIQGKEKVGIVGRTGAGKSSLMLALFRLVELAEGHIYIDGIDISQIGLKDLRSNLSIVPQDPILYTGTVRTNLDPFEEHTDKEVWDALENVHLKIAIEELPEKLGAPVSEGGENFSVGQKQLLCLARAILRQAKIMVMDEATAAVDFETDALIQKTIREQFANVTVLTIAHRIHTILDYDKILVLDKGLVAEFDSPANLLKNPNGIFYSMTHKSGTVETDSQEILL